MSQISWSFNSFQWNQNISFMGGTNFNDIYWDVSSVTNMTQDLVSIKILWDVQRYEN